MDTKKLRQKVLDLAIHGKLVKQDPNDEPACILLDRIRAEKARLVKEGKIKKSDLIEKPISEEEIPFEVPEGWEWCRLIEIYNFIDYRGSTPNKINCGIPLVTAKNVKRGYNDYSIKEYISLEEYEQRKGRGISRKGDILFTTEAPLGNVSIADLDVFSAGQRLITLQAYSDDNINNNCSMLFMLSNFFMQELTNKKTGSLVTGIKASILKDILLPIPPLAEQRRIVKAVDVLFEQIDIIERSEKELEEAANKTHDKLLNLAIQGHLVPQDPNEEPASVLLERIRAEKARLVKEGKLKKKDLEEKPISPDEIPFDIPEGWVWCRLGDLVMINPRNQADDNLDAAFIPMAYIDPNLQNTFRYEVKKWGQIKSSFTHLQDNDVVFAKITPCITNRKAAIMHDLPNGIGGGTTELNVFRVYGDTVNRFYLLYYLASEYFLRKASYKGTAGQQRIETKYVVNKPFPLPPLSEQRRIVTKLEELLQEIDKLKA